MKQKAHHICIARLGKSHGVHGWMRLQSFTEDPASALKYAPHWRLRSLSPTTHNDQALQLEASRQHTKGWLVKIKDCDSPEQAAYYTNREIIIDSALLPALSCDEVYWHQLEGFKVVNQQGIVLGHIDHLFSNGANDVIVVEGEKQYLIPYNQYAVCEIQLPQQTMIVDWDADF